MDALQLLYFHLNGFSHVFILCHFELGSLRDVALLVFSMYIIKHLFSMEKCNG